MSQTKAQLLDGKSATIQFTGGSASTPSVSFTGDTNTGIYSPGADQVAISTGGSGRLFIDSSGRVGIGTSSIRGTSLLDVRGDISFGSNANYYGLLSYNAGSGHWESISSDGGFKWIRASGPATSMTLDSSGRLGIGTTSPGYPLDLVGDFRSDGALANSASNYIYSYGGGINGQVRSGFYLDGSNNVLAFFTVQAERARIDSSGRLLVGTSSARTNFYNSTLTSLFQVENASGTRLTSFTYGEVGNSGPIHVFAKHRSASVGGVTIVADGDNLGTLSFQGSDGTEFVPGAEITVQVDGTPGANDMPGRLVFSTTADGASSPTERMRITSAGELLVGGTNDNGAYNIQCNGTGVWGFGAYVNGSDERLKENINPISSSLNVVKSLNPVTFQYKEEFTKDHSVQAGFIAQELQQALTGQTYLEGVVQTGPQYLNVAYQSLIPVLTKALQEAVAKIETLEAKVAALETK